MYRMWYICVYIDLYMYWNLVIQLRLVCSMTNFK